MLEDSLLIQAYRGRRGPRPPVWFMRQAGRFLPEYREIRAKYEMLEVIRTPRLAAEVTLQPVRRFGLDAAIIFADILNPLIGMGADLDFVAGEGPRISNPISSPEDVTRLKVPAVEDNVAYTLEAIDLAVSELNKMQVPLIGFSGAPFTLSCYLIEGRSSKEFLAAKRFMHAHQDAWQELQQKLVNLVSAYLIAQAKAGASALQLFDSWLGLLDPEDYEFFVEPYLREIVRRVKQAVQVPLVFFAVGTSNRLDRFAGLGADVLGVDWSTSLASANRQVGGTLPLQGNLDPDIMAGDWPALEAETRRILDEGRLLKAHVFNLGHGILPQTPVSNVAGVVEIVKRSCQEG